jgi:GDPmannose 4,6-dehydratase
VGLSFEKPQETRQSIIDANLHLLEEIRMFHPAVRFFNAGSGECFGETTGLAADEDTPFNPKSPYAEAKVVAFDLVKKYRDADGLFACTGILFNHESPLRLSRFVTQKIIYAAAEIKKDPQKILKLGNMEIERDWGWAPDYVEAMWLMLQQETPDDYVIATGKTRSVREFVEAALAIADLELDVDRFVEYDKFMIRPAEVDLLVGDAKKAKDILGWVPKTSFNELVSIMLKNDLECESRN